MSHGPLEPQILIYHSHSQETFSDSREGEEEDTIVGVGNYLTSLLSEKYGYQVIHIKEAFDMMSGELDRNKAYNYACDYVEKVLEENPSVEVVIDLHRDGIDEDRRLVTEINGKDTAQILFYNGLSYTNAQGRFLICPILTYRTILLFLFSWNIRRRCIILIFTEDLPGGLALQSSFTKKSPASGSRCPDKYGAGSKKRHGTLCRHFEQSVKGLRNRIKII